MKRGQIWVANLNPARGREVGKIRPVLVIQNDLLTEAGSPAISVLPLTTKVRPGLKLWRVDVPARDGLQQHCQVVVDQPRTLDRRRFGEGPLTSLSHDEMAAVERGLRVSLGMY